MEIQKDSVLIIVKDSLKPQRKELTEEEIKLGYADKAYIDHLKKKVESTVHMTDSLFEATKQNYATVVSKNPPKAETGV